MNIDLLLDMIHHVNNLFHLSENTGDHIVMNFFRKKKNEFQRELLIRFPEQIVLQNDNVEGMVLITIKNKDENACHYPKNLLPKNLLKDEIV